MPPASLPDFIDLQTAIARKPVIVAATTTVRDAIARMGARQASCVLVMAGNTGNTGPRKLLGILTAGDVVRLRAQELASNPPLGIDSAPIQTVMSQPVVTVNLADLSHWKTILALFQQARIHHLPVLNDHDRVVGVLTQDAVTERLMPALLRPSPVLGDTKPGEALALSQLNHDLQLTLEELQVAEEELRTQNLLLESERLKYEDLFKFAPEGYLVTDSLGVIQSANQAIAEMFGVNVSYLIDKPLVLFVAPADRPSLYSQLNQRLLHDRKQTWEITLQPRQGTPFPVEVTVVPIANPTKSLMDLRLLMRDIRDRKQAEALLSNQNAVLERIAKAEPLSAILDHLLRTMELQLVNASCSVMRLDREGRLRGVAAPQLPEAYVQAIDGMAIGEGVGSCGTAAFRRDTMIVSDIATHPFWQNFKELALAHGLRACWSLPMLANDGQVLGTFAVYHSEPHFPEAQELAVVARAANIASIAIEREQFTQALQQLNQELEQRVVARTAALQASEERWQLVLKGSNDGIWDWDVLTNQVFFSSRWKMMRGFAEDEIGDQRSLWSEGIHPEDRDRVLAAVDRHFSGATEFFEHEYRVRHKDGTYFWILDRAQALRDASGQVIRMSGSETDITLRKQSELALQASERRYATLAAAAPVAILRFDLDFNLIYANDRWHTMTGQSPETAQGRGWIETLHPDDLESLIARWTEMQTRSEVQVWDGGEGRHLRLDGTVTWFQVQIARELDANGTVVGYIGTLTDITPRKQAEQQLRDLSRRLDLALESAQIGTWELDLVRDRLFWDDRTLAIFGIRREDFAGTFAAWEERLHPEDLAHQQQEIQQQIWQSDTTSDHIEFRIIRPDGEIRFLSASALIQRNDQGMPERIVGLNVDITDRKQVELDNQRLRERLHFVLASSPAAIYTCRTDGDYGVTFMSDNIYDITGHTAAEFMDESSFWADRLHPEDAPSVFANMAQLFGQGSHSHEYRFRHHAGHYVWIQDGLRLVRDAQGQPLEIVGYCADISDRKQAELENQRLKERLQFVLSSSPAVIFTCRADDDYETTFMSDNIYAMTGYTPAQFMHEPGFWADRLHPEDAPQVFANLAQLLERESYVHEYRFRHHDGHYLWIEDGLRLVRDAQGQPLEFVGYSVDVSDRKAIEQQLQLTQYSVDHAADGILWINSEARFVYGNQAICQMLGYSLDELLQLTIADIDLDYPPTVCQAMWDQNSHNLTTEFGFETRHRAKDGRTYPVEVVGSYHQVAGKTLKFTRVRDISDRKQAEEALRLSEARFRNAFDNTAVGMALVNTDGLYLQVNAALCAFLDYSEAELLQLTFQQLSHPADLETDLELAQQVLAGARQNYHIEKRYITKPGQIVWGLLSISLIRDSQEQPLYFVSQIQDISDRKESEQRLEQTNAELMRATRLKDEFLANMSHELRTPLNAILGMAQGLQESIFGTSTEQQLHAYRIIESSGHHLLSLINDILDIAKIEAGQSNLEFAPTSISHLCQSSLVFVKQQALRKNIRIELRQPAPLPVLWADERRIRQVLINLLNNAVKFTSEGGRIILEVSSQVIHDSSNAGNWIQFSVTDTGIGIAPENIAKLFQPFIQIDSALNRKYTGTGLGLALVKNLVELHGGWVDITSELGQGSCFMFSLPGTAPTPANLALSTPQTTPDTTQGEPSTDSDQPAALPPLVLLTEDHDATILTVSSYLKAKGYRILVAKQGQAAIALTKAHRPDIILMDIQMPGIDGLTATREIRQDPDLAHIPIIALTALAMDEDRDRCIAAGATAYLAKPIQLKQLTNMIEQCLKA